MFVNASGLRERFYERKKVMYRLREIERRDIPVINGWRSDYDLSRKLGGGSIM